MPKKIRVGILFGGQSAEHEVSLQSAKNIISALDKNKYEPVLIGIGKNGQWHLAETANFLLNTENPKLIKLNESHQQITIVPGNTKHALITTSNENIPTIDVMFPVLHGPNGEDGTMQGLLKLARIPFVGADVLGSAVGMDKDVMKRLLRDAGIPTAKFLAFHESKPPIFSMVEKELGLPFFVKPANLGSSVGIHKVKQETEFHNAITDAFQYDTKILIEEYVEGREIECSVLGNQKLIASVPGEVITRHEFYSYDAKYIDEHGAKIKIPADVSPEISKQIQTLSIKTAQTLCIEGLGRVDFFLRPNGEVVVNEINTIPGFTNISMYPKLWEASGISNTELIDRLITLAIERFERQQKLRN